ncbi:hypothetical protein JKP88DRAFT_243996 [Tribonema minus]|uniref:Uncharacterized protein n=1 Tax=Tribonema minus TaxID=303371 RepID=A0A836CIQ2_9STRA|nr:hypothetical protein JKP88DRAFT_243996 [Tribonema minus]
MVVVWPGATAATAGAGPPPAGGAPSAPALDNIGKLLPGVGNQLYLSQTNPMSGRAEWVLFKNGSEVSEYKLPPPAQREVTYTGSLMRPFVGSLAFFRPEKALQVYWNGGGFYNVKDGSALEAPLSFIKCLPTVLGLVGHLHIPHDTVQDLLLPREQRDINKPDELYPVASTRYLVSSPTDPTTKYYPGSLRPVGDMPPQQVWEKAWEFAIFCVEDVYTMPGKSYAERLLYLTTHVSGMDVPCKQMQVVKPVTIPTEEYADELRDSTPADTSLVLVDPLEPFEGATTERITRPMRTYSGQRKADTSGRVVAHQLDASGRLAGFLVDDGRGSTKLVEEGALWVSDFSIPTVTAYNRNMQLKLRSIKQTDAPPQDKIDAVNAYQMDADDNASDRNKCKKNMNSNRTAFLAKYIASFADVNDPKHGRDPTTDALAILMNPAAPVIGCDAAGMPQNLLKFVHNMSRDTIPANAIVNFNTGYI